MRGDIILVGLGPYARAKYISLIEDSIASGRASACHVVELESVRDDVNTLFRTRACKPASLSWVPDLRRHAIWYSGHGEDVLIARASRRKSHHLDRTQGPFGLPSRGSWTWS